MNACRGKPAMGLPVWILLISCIVSVAHAVPPEVGQEAHLAVAAGIGVHQETDYWVRIESEIVPGTPEIIGRSYSVTVDRGGTAFVLNEDGAVLLPAAFQDDAPGERMAIKKAGEQIIADIGNIEHAKKYGMPATPGELESFRRYFGITIGDFYDRVYRAHPSAIRVEKISERITTDPSAGTRNFRKTLGGLEFTTIITPMKPDAENLSGYRILVLPGAREPEENVAIAHLSGKENYSSLELARATTVQPGDMVYAVPLGIVDGSGLNDEAEFRIEDRIETAVVRSAGDRGLRLDRSFGNRTVIILDGNGRPIGVGLGGDRVEPSSLLRSELEKNGIVSREGEITGIYRRALEAYDRGDYDAAREGFDQVLRQYPDHRLAADNLKTAETKSGDWGIRIHRMPAWQKAGAAVLLLLSAAIVWKLFR